MSFKDKGVVRDIARVLNIPLPDVNKVMKLVDTWDEYCTSKSTAEFRQKYPEIEKYGDQLRGRIRGTGIHAAGVVTAKEPIFRYAPMETRSALEDNKTLARLSNMTMLNKQQRETC